MLFDRKKPPPPGGVPIYYVPSSRTVSKRTPLEEFLPDALKGVLLLTGLDEGIGNPPGGGGFFRSNYVNDTRHSPSYKGLNSFVTHLLDSFVTHSI